LEETEFKIEEPLTDADRHALLEAESLSFAKGLVVTVSAVDGPSRQFIAMAVPADERRGPRKVDIFPKSTSRGSRDPVKEPRPPKAEHKDPASVLRGKTPEEKWQSPSSSGVKVRPCGPGASVCIQGKW
jgi:hypothetical protein